jgi:hypothetical protein
MVSSGMLRRVALVRTDVSEEPGASVIRVTRICELGTKQAATSNRRTLRRNTKTGVVYPFPEKGEAGASIDFVGSVRVDVVTSSQRTSVASCSLCYS